jgi:formyl-CoA transferase
MSSEAKHPLAGLRVLELGQLIAGPFAGAMLAGFGADVIKIEPPETGDPLRKWRKLHDGTSLWWRSIARNKRSVVVDLRTEQGRWLIRNLVASGEIDVIIENFRPGRMEAWGLGWEQLHALDRRLIMARISGYGQTGPRAHAPGFANVGAISSATPRMWSWRTAGLVRRFVTCPLGCSSIPTSPRSSPTNSAND